MPWNDIQPEADRSDVIRFFAFLASSGANFSCPPDSGRCFLDFPRGCPTMPTLNSMVQRDPGVSDLVAGPTVSYDLDSSLVPLSFLEALLDEGLLQVKANDAWHAKSYHLASSQFRKIPQFTSQASGHPANESPASSMRISLWQISSTGFRRMSSCTIG
jgi:hypothetical protein